MYFFLIAITVFFSLLIAGLIVFYAVKYRRRSPEAVGVRIHGGLMLEMAWTVIPFMITMVIFVWGASVYFAMASPPAETLNVYVVGKQWMWKFQHLDGQREINELHVPVGRNVKLIMTSEDVIHDLFFPAFRVKADVLPGRYVNIWFNATKPGRYHLFCAEYCGTRHSGMIGEVIVMEAERVSGLAERRRVGGIARVGRREAVRRSRPATPATARNRAAAARCSTGSSARPSPPSTGETIVVDEAYIRESILNPSAKVQAGYQPIMPTFQGVVNEEGLLAAHRVREVAPRRQVRREIAMPTLWFRRITT